MTEAEDTATLKDVIAAAIEDPEKDTAPALHEEGGDEGPNNNNDDDDYDDASAAGKAGKAGEGDERAVRKRLSAGFRALRKHRDTTVGPSDSPGMQQAVLHLRDLTPDFLAAALVNFIDPTSAPGQGYSPTKSSNSARHGGGGGSKPPLELYQKLSAVFSTQYHWTLRNVPCQHFRSYGGAPGIIDSLPVHPYLTRSPLLLISGEDEAPYGGQSSDWLSGDPSEWHTAPYCHVYLAACESLEEYRTKVKPSIQAFVSQIESASAAGTGSTNSSLAAESAAPAPSSGGSACAQYVIVFVPTGDHSSSEEHGKGGRFGTGWTSRVAAAGRRMAREAQSPDAPAGHGHHHHQHHNSTSSDDLDPDGPDPGTTATSSISGTGSTHTPTSGSNLNLTSHLSKVDRDLSRRFAADFGGRAGKVCTLGTLVTETENSSNQEQHRELQKLEWREFLRCLASAVGDGFRDRCQRYDEELRQQDALRATAVALATATDARTRAQLAMQQRLQQRKFDLVYFFLVKESLAYTYEQMRQPSEALLQYDELHAVLPDLTAEDHASSHYSYTSNGDELSQLALNGDCVNFRRRVRTMDDLKSIAPVLQHYLLSRETLLLFKMNNPVVAAQRCMAFVRSMYSFKKELLPENNDDDDYERQRKAVIEVEKWAFEFCWDVKTACDIYLADDVTESQCNDNFGKPHQTPKNDEALARCICDLLEFARLRLVRIGDLTLEENPVRSYLKVVDQVLLKEWKPWRPGTSNEDESFHEEDYEPGQEDFIQDALSSKEAFLTRYLELLKVMAAFNRFSGRKRCAARVCVEVAGIYVAMGSPERAIVMLREAAQVYAQDHWQSCNFMLLFRLAAYQREYSTADDYIDTLVQCFSPAHTQLAPSKALDFLLADLESVLHSSLVSRIRLSKRPIFEALLGLEGYKVSQRTGSVRDLLKKVYAVGENACVTLALTSFLPKEIEAEEISVELVPFRAYIAAMEDSTVVKDDDVFHVLQHGGPVKIIPGLNELSFDWVPMAPGQFILCSTTIKWKGVRFCYYGKDQKRPTIRVDVIPSEPTQSIEMTPDYLVPEHEQPVKLTFKSGSDIVKEANIMLACSDGLLLLPPGCKDTDEGERWSSSCESTLPQCMPGETHEMMIKVKPSAVDTSTLEPGPQALRATVSTLYQCPYPEGTDESPQNKEIISDSFMEHNMIHQIFSLEKKMLTIESIEMLTYALDRATLSVQLQCNSPTSIVVKSWKISLPSFIALAKDGDYNSCLSGVEINPGEPMSMSFDCAYTDNASEVSAPSDSHLTVEVQDEFGHIFPERVELGLKRRTGQRVILPELKTVQVQVTPSTLQGLAGVPITLLFKIDTRDLLSSLASSFKSGSVHYQLSFDSMEWIVSGKTEGTISPIQQAMANNSNGDSLCSLEFLAIPARPGVIEHYPSLSLYYQSSSSSSISDSMADAFVLTPLEGIEVVVPGPFHSLPPPVHTTVAVAIQAAKQNRGSFVL